MAELKEITINDITKVLIIVSFEDGSAHQVLSTAENKNTMLRMLAVADGGLKLDKELMPIKLKTKK